MTSQPSSSEERNSSAFYQLHQEVQRWIYQQGWTELREIQETAIAPILSCSNDVILAAPTAGGKTEAAFLPILSRLVQSPPDSIGALYVSPLKALINDQFGRLEQLCERLGLSVHRWHGDVSSSRKKEVLKDPQGILLITPESLEAMFILRGSVIPKIFEQLSYVVIDELHSFIGTERGRQLQSLLHRLELTLRRRIPRVGLSATLGDMNLAANFLRIDQTDKVQILCSGDGSQDIRLQIRGYRSNSFEEVDNPSPPDKLSEIKLTWDVKEIARHLMSSLRGSNNLIFCNSRRSVEMYADLLRRFSDEQRVPNEFFPHHGNLAKELREELEDRLKHATLPVTAVCTTTLELGIDIGNVKSISQVGCPFTVASLRQRLGRSGRRGEAAIMRLYIQEETLSSQTSLIDALRMNLVQAMAMVRLLVRKWYEPPIDDALHLSTLVQQILSMIAQHGAAKAQELWVALCQSGPFKKIDQGMFAELLRSLGQHELLTQCHDGSLVIGPSGEALVNHYDFYAAFTTPEEYRLGTDQSDLGTIPLEQPVVPGMYLIFAGRRWEVISVEARQRRILVKPAEGGKPPVFGGGGGTIHEGIRKEMLEVYKDQTMPPFLDFHAADLLKEGRETFTQYHLAERSLVSAGTDQVIFPWAGDRVVNTIAMMLASRGVKVSLTHGTITALDTDAKELRCHLDAILATGPIDALALAEQVPDKLREKHHRFLSDKLLNAEYAARSLDTHGAAATVQYLLRSFAA